MKTAGETWAFIKEDYERGHRLKKEGKPIAWSCALVEKDLFYAFHVDDHVPPFGCPFVRSALELAISGAYDYLDGVVIPHTCDLVGRMEYWWRTVASKRSPTLAGLEICPYKGVVLRGKEVISFVLVPTVPPSEDMGDRVFRQILDKGCLLREEIQYVVSTGYGRVKVPFSDEIVSEIACHAKGCHFFFPQVRTILDVGGQDCKAIRVDEKGNHVNFAMNDKCAAGTGRFLENVAGFLNLGLSEIGNLALKAEREAKISSTCAVFAKSEVVSMMRGGISKGEILAGLHEAISSRICTLLRQVKVNEDLVISGGGAKNRALVEKIEEKVGMKAHIPGEPQMTGALGAALFAWERIRRKGETKGRR